MRSYLTVTEVRQILKLRGQGFSTRVVADMVGRCHRTVLIVEKRKPPTGGARCNALRVRKLTYPLRQLEYQRQFARRRRRERTLARGGYAAMRIQQIEGEAS